ncbi:MAG: long-chain fatty acid--CoA ligase [Deltaproteobacteria bacterium]|nr:long-chain fatty acid--CoA ligase [Deltaproteobacteria bacterium]
MGELHDAEGPMLETAPHAPVTYASRSARNVGEMFRIRAKRSGPSPALYAKRDGRWDKTTWAGFYDEAREVLAGLLALGLGRGDKVAILGDTHKPWAVLDMGAQLGGLVTYGIYPKQPVDHIRYLLSHADTRVIFVDSPSELLHVLAAADQCPMLLAIVPYGRAAHVALPPDPRIVPPSAFGLDPNAKGPTPTPEPEIDVLLAAIDPQDTAILVYTSGTTGPPKAAMLTHFNILDLLSTQSAFLDLYQDDLSLSFLPMAHVAERILAFYGRVCTGLATAYATSTATVLDELQEVQPTVFGSVPRIFEKAYIKLTSELDKKPAAVRRLFAWALNVGTRRTALLHAKRPVPFALRVQDTVADRLVWRRVRHAFGGRVRFFVTGAAPIARPILELFWAAKLPVYEAYGMTESTVATHINRPGDVRLGSVGKVIPPMECRIAEDGEILLRGPWVMKGYYKQPEATAACIDNDGWLHTGDIGVVDADGFLTITDRKKHLIITAGGKNLAPANIEKAIREESPFISQVHAHGDRRPFVAALIAPSPIETLELGVTLGLVTGDDLETRKAELLADPTSRTPALEAAVGKVTRHPTFVDKIVAAVRRGNAKLAQVEQVRRFAILDRDFSQEHGELTPTMKLRRKDIETNHAATLDRLYADPSFGHDAT